MARTPRLKPAPGPNGTFYHITTRCALQRHLLNRPDDRALVAALLHKVAVFSGIAILDYCIMTNHLHLLVKVPAPVRIPRPELLRRFAVLYGRKAAEELAARWSTLPAPAVRRERSALRRRMGDITPFMQCLKQRITIAVHARQLRRAPHAPPPSGTLWQGRFHSVLVESGAALRAVAAYIDLNPVRARMVSAPEDYPDSARGAATRGSRAAATDLSALAALVGDYSCLLVGRTPDLPPSAPVPDDLPPADLLRIRQPVFSRALAIGTPLFVVGNCAPHLAACGRRRPIPAPVPLHPAHPVCIPESRRRSS